MEQVKVKDKREFVFMNSNANSSLVSIQKSGELSICFRHYSALDVYLMLNIEKILEKECRSIQPNETCPSLYTVNIQGDTFFSIFYKKTELMDLVCK